MPRPKAVEIKLPVEQRREMLKYDIDWNDFIRDQVARQMRFLDRRLTGRLHLGLSHPMRSIDETS